MNRDKRSFMDDDEETPTIKAPTMARSRSQIGSAYAPGAFFTFEGGLGSCISRPDSSHDIDAQIDLETKNQIILRLHDIWQSWFERAYSTNTPDRFIDPRQCIEGALLRNDTINPLGIDQLAFLNPLKMGYAPAPLTFVCNKCHRFRRFDNIAQLTKNINSLSRQPCLETSNRGSCQWRQLDVIFVHWSGQWEAARPGRWEWDDNTSQNRIIDSCRLCRGTEFKLNTESPQIGKWFFYCADQTCGQVYGEWRQHDEFTTSIFRNDSTRRLSERRMEPISYRASSAHYAQTEQFVAFPQSQHHLLKMLEPDRRESLETFIGNKFQFAGQALTDVEIRETLLASGHEDEWETLQRFQKMRSVGETVKDDTLVKEAEDEIEKLKKRWASSEPPIIAPCAELPVQIKNQLLLRNEYTSRYDPFVLAVEHEALEKGKLSSPSISGRAPFVRFDHLDNDLAPKEKELKNAQESRTVQLKEMLGIKDIGLIREFDLCRFTHGYTRVSAVPTMEKRGLDMPVRLRLFESLRNNKRPIYVITQSNEAIYVHLDPASVYSWLLAVGTTDLPDWDPNGTLKFGGALLQTAQPFGRYFSRLRKGPASTYRYVYSLLHSYSHVFMRNIAELSGLDLGSMGEYIFPLDLAFVVYRNGTTMDLGNLSSLWRNENNRFLSRLLEPSTHRCNSGRLCDTDGGACPDCIMIPETSCVAQNQLLSRAVLRGGPAPREDETHEYERIPGFLEVVNEQRERTAS